jgi:quercetin dioxygenase-like cupin family protein
VISGHRKGKTMRARQVIEELRQKYPGKKIIKHKKNPTEILCEVDPSVNHPEYSLAVAVIDKSISHIHRKSKETYKVVKGKLSLFVDGKKHELKEGDEFEVNPGQTHWAEGNETWIMCYSEPGWTFKDHILEKER